MLKALGLKKKSVEETYNNQIGRIDYDLVMARGQAKLAGVRLEKAVSVMDGIDNNNVIMKRNAACDVVKNRHNYTAAFDRQRVLEQKKEKLTGQKEQIVDHNGVASLHKALERAGITPEKLVGQKALEAGWDEAFEAAGESDKVLLANREDEVNELMNAHYGRPNRNDEIPEDEVEAVLREGAR